MAKKYYDKEISFDVDWGGDVSTNNQPVSGRRVQEAIKKEVNSKAGHIGLYSEGGYYVLCKDAATYDEWLKTVNAEGFGQFGDESLIIGRFSAPYNYTMKISFIDPQSGYKSTLVGSEENTIRFRATTVDKEEQDVNESITVTVKVTNENGISTQQKMIYSYDKISNSEGVVYDLNGKLSAGKNTITVQAVGMTTDASAMRSITYNYVDIYYKDTFDITKSYTYDNEGNLTINVGYELKGIGETTVHWYFDGQLVRSKTMSNDNPNLIGQNESFYFNKNINAWATAGKHTLQMYMECEDMNSREVFFTPVYYREFIIEDPLNTLTRPFVMLKCEYDFKDETSIVPNGTIPMVYGGKKFENTVIKYGVYYNGYAVCKVETYVSYNGGTQNIISTENIPLENNFSALIEKYISLEEKGRAAITFKAYKYESEESFDTDIWLDVDDNDMKFETANDNVVLYLNASGRTNEMEPLDSWVFTYVENGKEKKIETTFYSNEYVMVSDRNEANEVMKPSEADETNSLVVNSLPSVKNEDYEYLIYNGDYYVWASEFDWSETSGWFDNKLKLGKDNMISIDFQPFSAEMISKIKQNGATFEFEFETTNVYDDNAVICRICGTNNFAPGISIYASGAELVISREVVEGEYDDEGNQINTNAGYIKAVSTKYKSEESNRISFVITPDIEGNREKLLLIYVNGECCGAYPYSKVEDFFNASKITFRGTEKACVNILNMKLYSRRLKSNEILNNYIYYRLNTTERNNLYRRNDIMTERSDEVFEPSKLYSQLPVMTFYQLYENEGIDILHQEKKNKTLPAHFDVVYIDVQDSSKNFVIKNAYVTPQGTSSMNYPVKNFRLYTDKDKKSPATLYVGDGIFINGDTTDLRVENLNPECIVSNKKYAMRDNSIPVKCWCLKADFAESSSSHNTGTARYWGEVLRNGGYQTKAQAKAALYQDEYKNADGIPYDVRTTIDGFPIVLFYQDMKGSSLRFEGKYNFNNDKSTEDVFGFTGGVELNNQVCKYFYIGNEMPVRHYDSEKDEWSCEFGEYTENPTEDSPLYASGKTGEWYMLRGKELLDNPKMECWELLNSVNEIALFKTMKGFGIGDDDEKVGIVDGENFDEAFESRYPDCGDYYHYNSLKRFGEWLVSCRYLKVDANGKSVPFELNELPSENYYLNAEGKLSIQSLSKQEKTFTFDYPNYNFYKEVDYDTIASAIVLAGYQAFTLPTGVTEDQIGFIELEEKPNEIYIDEEGKTWYYIKVDGKLYSWGESNLGVFDVMPEEEETSYDFIKVGEKYFKWSNVFNFSDYYDVQWVDDTPFNRGLKFAVEKYDHIEMGKMAAYYIYLMRFGGVDQTVKNSMFTTEGPATDDPNSTLPSLWYFINYDNDTILGVKNDGRLVFDPYITRETKDGTGFVYAGRESTLWNNLEADIEFMNKVTAVDNDLAEGKGDSKYALSYNNAIREYDINQSDKWCERIYNKDAERKYIDTYVKGWTQHNSETNETLTNVYEDYLYDVQGSRSAHRKWWLGRRFNIYDSKFCNTNFRSSFIKFRSSNLPTGSSFKIKSGEPIYYAWGHDNNVTEITPNPIQPNDEYTFVTRSTFNIGSYLEVMGAANIIAFDLTGCVGDLTEINIENCYSPTIGTKLRELLIGDHNRTDLKNISTTQMNFGGLGSVSRLEVLDVTNIQNIFALDGLEKLTNIRELYTKGTKVSDYEFANGAQIETIEFAKTVKSISFTKNTLLKYSGLKFEDVNYGGLSNLSIVECPHLLKDPTFIFDWLSKRTAAQKENINLNLQGIEWTLYGNEYTKLFALEGVGTSDMGSSSYGGTIKITADLGRAEVERLKKIFGPKCFIQGASLHIEAPTNVYITSPTTLWEGTEKNKFYITLVGASLKDTIEVYASVIEDDEEKFIDGIDEIRLDTTMLNEGYVTVDIDESLRNFTYFFISVNYRSVAGAEQIYTAQSPIKKRVYPDTENGIKVITSQDSYNNTIENEITLDFTPDIIDDIKYEGRGYFTVEWKMVTGTTNYENKLILTPKGEKATIQARQGWDGTVVIGCSIVRNWDGSVITYGEKELEFTDPNTIITRKLNEPVYEVLLNHGIIKENEDGYGFLTKSDASKLTMADLVDANGVSIFKGNKEIISFLEFEFFNGSEMGQMPMEGINKQLTPVGMFQDCVNLKQISLSNGFAYANNNMFSGCTSLEAIYGYERLDGTGRAALGFQFVGENFASGCKKLKTCLIGNQLSEVGNNAFLNCESLETFQISTTENLEIKTSYSSTPFKGCKNITFTGMKYPEDNSNAAYQVIDGSVYKIEDDKYTLIRMGKNSLISNIPTDRPVYACANAMEYRMENDIVVPDNVIFNGANMFYGSTGNSVTLTRTLDDAYANSLFEATNFKGNYIFANGETRIPYGTFRGITGTNELTIPEGIKKIEGHVFYGTGSLVKITFPSTLEKIESNSFWLATNLKTLIFNGPTPPSIAENDFFNVMIDDILVKPEYYQTYKENIMHLLRPFITVKTLYSEGIVRIIKDGYYVLNDEDNIITVGGLATENNTLEDVKYVADGIVSDINIYLNGESIGKIAGQYTTIYVGDNSSLFEGDGINLRKGFNSSNYDAIFKDNNWFYDARFEGVRNSGSTNIVLTFDNYANKDLKTIFGNYAEKGYGKFYFKNSNGNILATNVEGGINEQFNGYEIEEIFSTVDGKLNIVYEKGGIATGIDGIVINEIGDSIYSDPEIITTFAMNENMNTKTIEVNLFAETEIPETVYVTVIDKDKTHEYRKYWKGETLYFTIPVGYDFFVSATNFVTDKKYTLKTETIVGDKTIIDLEYESKSGIEILDDNHIAYYGNYADWYLCIKPMNGAWGEAGYDTPEINVEDIDFSEADGYENTKLLSIIGDNIFKTAIEYEGFGNNIVGYIPSYIEISMFSEHLSEINEYLISKNKDKINFNGCWVSESFDADNAWTADGEKKMKSEKANYFIFGKIKK